MGFFSELDAASNWETRAAKQLSEVITTAGHSLKGTQPRNWPASLRKLGNKHTQPAVDRVLAWLPSSINRPYVPHVRSANSFCQKFERLLELSTREGPQDPSTLDDMLGLVDEQPRVWPWEPAPLDEAYWLSRVQGAYSVWLDEQPDQELVLSVFGPPSVFVQTWREECRILARETDRDFCSYEWSADNILFQKLRRRLGLIAA